MGFDRCAKRHAGKIQDANQYVLLKGVLLTYKDGSKNIDADSTVQIFGQTPNSALCLTCCASALLAGKSRR